MKLYSNKKLQRFTSILVIIIALCSVLLSAVSEEEELETIWVLCQPNSYVNIRVRPSGRSEACGYADCGDDFYTDGYKKNGFLHVYASIETGEGWIALGYVIWDEPERIYEKRTIISKGRVKARKTVNGKRRMWLYDGDEVKVYWMSESWSVTNKGFVKSEFIGEQ